MRHAFAFIALAALLLPACSSGSGPQVPPPGNTTQSRHIALPAAASSFAVRKRMDVNGNLADGGFESGGFSYWEQCGNVNASITTARSHSGTHSELSGSTSSPEVNGDAGVCQQVTVPTGGRITFWVYQGTNETSIKYAYQEADFLDSSGYVLDNFYMSVSNSGGWKQLTYDASAYAGQTVWLYFGAHGNGWTGGYIYQYVDDVAWGGSATPTPSPTATPTGAPTPTPVPSATPTPGQYPCNNQQFLTDQSNFAAGKITADQFVQVCGAVTKVLPAKTTTSGRHGYFYVQMPSGYNIEIVSNLDAMAKASTNKPPATWPWVAVGNYVYVQGRYYYDNASSQGIDWTEDDTGSSWQHTGDVVVCNSAGAACNFYW